MALGKIYLGSNVIMDGPSIATAIGSEAASALTFADLVSIIDSNKSNMSSNLITKGVSSSSSETLSSLVGKILDIPSNDPAVIISAIGSELASGSTTQQIADVITSDKQLLVSYLNLYGLTGQSYLTTLSTLIAQLGNINATRYYQLTENFNMSSYITSLNTILSGLTDNISTSFITPDDNAVTEDMTDISGLSNLGSISDSVSSLLQTVLGFTMTANTTTGPILSDIMSPMSSDTSADGSSSAPSHYDAGLMYYPWKAFDGNVYGNSDASGGWVTVANTVTGWLQFQFNSAQVVKQYNVVGWRYDASLSVVTQSFPKNWTFQGSNNGTDWTTLDTQTNQSVTTQAQIKTYAISNTTAYTYYRLNITANNGYTGYTAISQLQLFNTVPSAPVYYASASTIYNSTYDAWKAFNRSIASDDCWITVNNTLTGWLKYQFPVAKVVNCYEVYSRNEASTGISSYPKNFTFEGSNDNSNWTTLDTQTNQSVTSYNGGFNSYTISNSDSYLYYRLNISANNGNASYTTVGELRLLNV